MRDDLIKRARILVVDDQEANVLLVDRILRRAGYTNVRSTTDSAQVAALYAEYAPDLLVLDLMMPDPDGFAVMEELSRRIPEGEGLPILVLTADTTTQAKYRALSMGARDFLTKPFDPTEALLRIRNLLELGLMQRSLLEQNRLLEQRVRDRTRSLEQRLEAAIAQSEHRRALLASVARPGGVSHEPSSGASAGSQTP